MPPEMITIVAPIAMIAKKLASVAVCTSVYELRKSFAILPVSRSACEPVISVSATATSASTMTSPTSCEEISRRSVARTSDGPGRRVRRAIAIVVPLILEMGARIRPLERRAPQSGLRRGTEVRKRAAADGREQRRAVRRPLLAIHRAYGQPEHL